MAVRYIRNAQLAPKISLAWHQLHHRHHVCEDVYHCPKLCTKETLLHKGFQRKRRQKSSMIAKFYRKRFVNRILNK